MKARLFLFSILVFGLLHAIVVSGDNGISFAKNKSAEMCGELGVSAVYVCLDNAVKVVWEDTSQGATYYKADGIVLKCPPGEVSATGAACFQMNMPNYCAKQITCAQKPQPPQNVTNETPVQPPQNETKPAEKPPEKPRQNVTGGTPTQEGPLIIPINFNVSGIGLGPATEGQAFDLLSIGIIVLAIAAIVLLYFAFKKMVLH
ncbi:MAG: hypothetical protein V1492_03690 [Candidatus Micrarchaeota archaeon]